MRRSLIPRSQICCRSIINRLPINHHRVRFLRHRQARPLMITRGSVQRLARPDIARGACVPPDGNGPATRARTPPSLVRTGVRNAGGRTGATIGGTTKACGRRHQLTHGRGIWNGRYARRAGVGVPAAEPSEDPSNGILGLSERGGSPPLGSALGGLTILSRRP